MLLAFLIFGGEAMAFQIQSPAFQDKGEIPIQYTCDGENVSPPLVWSEVPEGAQSFALISDDPDAPMGTWVHWVLYDMPKETTGLDEGLARDEVLPNGAKQGMNDSRKVGYGGPCPPPGPAHRYFFKLYALDTTLNLSSKATKADLLLASNDHILAQAEIVGLYKRKR